ncbi:MAG: GNAT family N-acetyltransferase [Candidatus Krumholzibacteria bacterium]|nr:GNAT family N-acetyltransferase [Candidatus Krumholzibacteria bacterium]
MIPLFRPSISNEEIEAVTEVLKSGWWGLGPKTAEFEEKFAKYIGVKHAVGLNSGTAALHLALALLDLKRGDEVIVPPITFVSTAHAVVYNGAKPVFADVYEDNLCIDVEDVARKITKRTRAILPVHYAGHPCDMDGLRELAKGKRIAIVEDAAHACGAQYKGKKIGSISELTCFSFHAVKNVACGEGGMVTTNNDEWDKWLREMRWLGISKSTWNRTVDEKVYAWFYHVNRLGFKAHLNDIPAAIGIVQLARLDALNARRREVAGIYNRAFKNIKGVKVPVERKGCKSSWHIYHLKVDKRDDLIKFLKDNDIAPGVHYYPIHLHPYYRSQRVKLPVAEEVWKRIISLPCFPGITEEEMNKVIGTVGAFFARPPVIDESRLLGKKVALRGIEASDLETLREWRNRKENRQAFFHQEPIVMEQQQEWYNRYLKDDSDMMFMIEDARTRTPIGAIAIYHIDHINRQCEIGRIMIGNRRYLGKGYAHEATTLLLNRAFKDLGLNRIYLEVFNRNSRAIALYESCGFATEGIKREAVVVDGKRYDVRVMSVLKKEFPGGAK